MYMTIDSMLLIITLVAKSLILTISIVLGDTYVQPFQNHVYFSHRNALTEPIFEECMLTRN